MAGRYEIDNRFMRILVQYAAIVVQGFTTMVPNLGNPPRCPSPMSADPLFNQSLEKGLEVLRAFSAVHRTLTLSEVAGLTGMTKSSAQRTVHTLESLGYIDKHPQ